MTRALILGSLAISLAACASGANGDVATYDTLKLARSACAAKGEELVLTTDGDPQRLSAYTCKRK